MRELKKWRSPTGAVTMTMDFDDEKDICYSINLNIEGEPTADAVLELNTMSFALFGLFVEENT